MKTKNIFFIIAALLLTVAFVSYGQTVDGYEETEETGKGLFDPSRLTVRHALSFGAFSSSNISGLKSQSLYTTMMTYQFSKPVTLNFNVGLPIHSTFSSEMNLNPDNIQSMEYFQNIPFDASLLWQPSENFAMQIRVMRGTPYYSPFISSYYSPFGGFLGNW